MRTFLILFSLLSLGVVALRAELAFAQTRIEAVAAPGDTRYEAVFPFTNTGEEPVTIAAVKSSCGCTVPELAKHDYAPGESGELRAVFTFGARTGEQRKVIDVSTAGQTPQHVQLTLIVDIPQLLAVKPRLLLWKQGEDAGAKEAAITLAAGVGAIPDWSPSSPEGFSLEMDPPRETGEPYVLRAKPTDTSAPRRAKVELRLPDPAHPGQWLAETSFYLLVR